MRSFVNYAMAKCREEDLWQNYIADCAWAGSTDFRFTESDEPREPVEYPIRATLQRWHEIRYPEKEEMLNAPQNKKKISKDSIKEWLLSRKVR